LSAEAQRYRALIKLGVMVLIVAVYDPLIMEVYMTIICRNLGEKMIFICFLFKIWIKSGSEKSLYLTPMGKKVNIVS
jgi:hypothetical protein